MKKTKKRNLREQSKLLVESILDKDPITANSIFQRLILEAEEAREEEVLDELGLDDETDTEVDAEVDTETDVEMEGDEETADELGMEDSVDDMSNEESDKIVDDIVEINCQINAKMISKLFDRIAEIKTNILNLGLDENSREFLKYDITIQYYSDKLQNLQNKTNPGIDQEKVEIALQKITEALDELESESGETEADITDVNTPEEVEADAGLTEDEVEADVEETEAESEEGEEDAEVTADDETAETEEEDEETSDTDELDELFG